MGKGNCYWGHRRMTDLFTYSPPPSVAFDGATYDWRQDHARLKSQLHRVYTFMSDGGWHTLSDISAYGINGSEASVSARLRDLRKEQYGGHEIDRERVEGGLFRYRMKI